MCPTAATCGSVKRTRGERGPVLGCRRALAEYGVGGHAGLVLADVGQQGAGVNVAHSVEPVTLDPACTKLVVDVDPRSGLEPDGFQSELVGAGAPPNGDGELVGFHRGATFELDGHLAAARLSVHGNGPRIEQHVHAALAKGRRHLLGRKGLLAAEQTLPRLDQRHL